MKSVRWIFGLGAILLFGYLNFVAFQAELYIKLVNVFLFCSLFILYRVIVGPTAADRIVAVDIFGVLIIGMLAVLGMHYKQGFFMDIGLIWALLSFVASLAFAKTLEGRSLDD